MPPPDIVVAPNKKANVLTQMKVFESKKRLRPLPSDQKQLADEDMETSDSEQRANDKGL